MNRIRRLIRQFLFLKSRKWQEIEYFNPQWKERILQMAALIPDKEGQKVMDLGCGKMWLKDYLPENYKYIPVDYISRGEGTIVCDFNKGEFPVIHADISFVSGCLEYINDFERFVQSITQHSDSCVISYCSIKFFPDRKDRIRRNWVNNLSEQQLIQLFTQQNFKLIQLISQENSIFLFRKENHSD